MVRQVMAEKSKNVKYTTEYPYESKIYIGSKEGYNGNEFNKYELYKAISAFQEKCDIAHACTVRVSNTTYIFRDYIEDGWEIAVINYPRFVKAVDVIETFTIRLAEFLLKKFKQNRMSVITPSNIIMIESENCEEKHN